VVGLGPLPVTTTQEKAAIMSKLELTRHAAKTLLLVLIAVSVGVGTVYAVGTKSAGGDGENFLDGLDTIDFGEDDDTIFFGQNNDKITFNDGNDELNFDVVRKSLAKAIAFPRARFTDVEMDELR